VNGPSLREWLLSSSSILTSKVTESEDEDDDEDEHDGLR